MRRGSEAIPRAGNGKRETGNGRQGWSAGGWSKPRFPFPISRFPSILAILLAVLSGCEPDIGTARAAAITGGDPDAGAQLIRSYGCGTCHEIPGIPGARGTVGPPLAGLARRTYVGGVIENTPDNLVRWIVDPREIDDRTAMPVLGVSPQHARDIAAYLYSRR